MTSRARPADPRRVRGVAHEGPPRRSCAFWPRAPVGPRASVASLADGPAAQAQTVPAPRFVGASTAARSNARSLAIARPRRVTAGDVMVAALDVRVASAARIRPPRGWRLIRAD